MTLLVLDLSSAGPWVGLAMSGACVAAVGYLLGRRRTTKPGFRAREIGGWLVRSAAPSDAGHIHRMVKELAEFEKMGDGAKLTVRDFSDHLASGSFECLLLEVRPAWASARGETADVRRGVWRKGVRLLQWSWAAVGAGEDNAKVETTRRRVGWHPSGIGLVACAPLDVKTFPRLPPITRATLPLPLHLRPPPCPA